MQRVTEVKHKLMGERLQFPCEACLVEPPERAVLRYVVQRGWSNVDPPIQVPQGTLSYAYYWRDRNYNVYHWLHPDGQTIGFYFNLARHTSIHPWGVEWHDLEVDVWVDAEGQTAMLDEDAVPATVDADLHHLIDAGKMSLVQIAPTVTVELREQTKQFLAQGSGGVP